jgi:hypothetical protein
LKYIPLLARLRTLTIALVLLSVSLLAAGIWRSGAVLVGKSAADQQLLNHRIRKGIGSEVAFAAVGSDAGSIRASVNSVDQFIFKRSGAKLPGPTKNRLADMEARALDGAAPRLTITELANILTDVALERLHRLTDQEIAHVDKSLRGFHDPALPESFRRGRDRFIKLRAGSLRIMSSEKFTAQVKALRSQVGTPIGEIFEGMTRNAVRESLSRRASLFSAAVPEKFGSAWDVANDRESSGVTPLQAVLFAYSVASEDLLCDSEETLGKYMRAIQISRSGSSEKTYPSPDGQSPYGDNGYIFSSPIDLVFDELTINSLLDQIEGRSAQ